MTKYIDLENELDCLYANFKDTKNTLTIVANYVNVIDSSFDETVIIIDLLAKYSKTTKKLTLNYEIPLIGYSADIKVTKNVEKRTIKHKRSGRTVHKDNGEPEYIEVKGTIPGYENDMTRMVHNPSYKEWDEEIDDSWVEHVEDVSYDTKINKTLVQDFNEKNKLIEKILKEKIKSVIPLICEKG